MISHLGKESGGGKEGEWRWKTATDHLAITQCIATPDNKSFSIVLSQPQRSYIHVFVNKITIRKAFSVSLYLIC